MKKKDRITQLENAVKLISRNLYTAIKAAKELQLALEDAYTEAVETGSTDWVENTGALPEEAWNKPIEVMFEDGDIEFHAFGYTQYEQDCLFSLEGEEGAGEESIIKRWRLTQQ